MGATSIRGQISPFGPIRLLSGQALRSPVEMTLRGQSVYTVFTRRRICVTGLFLRGIYTTGPGVSVILDRVTRAIVTIRFGKVQP